MEQKQLMGLSRHQPHFDLESSYGLTEMLANLTGDAMKVTVFVRNKDAHSRTGAAQDSKRESMAGSERAETFSERSHILISW